MRRLYTPEERSALARALAADADPGPTRCPRCGEALARRAVPPRSDVAYVRDRIWLLCPGCGGSAAPDR